MRLTGKLLAWLKETLRRIGVPMGQFFREQLESARSNSGKQRFLRHAGALSAAHPIFHPERDFRGLEQSSPQTLRANLYPAVTV